MVVFLLACIPLLAPGQAIQHDNKSTGTVEGEHALKRIVDGHGRLSGNLMVFRVYEAADGTRGRISYVKFPTLQDAQRQIDAWLKLAAKVMSRDYDKKKGNVWISERIVAEGIGTPSEKEFLIIRRNGLICYFVHSPSLQTAMHIEDTID